MGSGFTEKDFYLAEYHGRTLAMAIPAAGAGLDVESRKRLSEVLDDLADSRIHVVLLCDDPDLVQDLATATPGEAAAPGQAAAPLDASAPGWIGRLWRGLQQNPRAILVSGSGEELPALATRVCLRLKLAKLVWLSDAGAIRGPDGERVSLIDLAGLESRLASDDAVEDAALLREIRTMIAGGLPSVSLCEPAKLADELYTYAGSGTFFSRERYVEVRNLALDEFSAAVHLIARGVEEGYLVSRSPEQVEATLGSAFGAFVEGRYLAGICALLDYPDEGAGEISSLYALTRFVGEGVGGHLVRFALEQARARGHGYVFACTTSPRVESFFHRNGFETVARSDIPDAKWARYAPERIEQVHCLRHTLR